MANSKKNSKLNKAKKAKNDEFYTQYIDIEREMQAYLDYDENVFRGKTILLPCDHPEWSNFTKYFLDNFEKLGLKELISTCYIKDSKGKIFRKTKNNEINSLLNGDGDFRTEEVMALRNEADIIITNPPFSLFREFIAWIVQADKKFAIIGNMNAITYKQVFPLIKDNKIWLGVHNGAKDYLQPGGEMQKMVYTLWFTNLKHGRRNEPLQLMTMADNLKYNKKLEGKSAYLEYDNYNAIEVPFTNAIPSDYNGVMGVPISFLDKYNPDQFEILDANDFRRDENFKIKPHGLIKDKDGAIKGKPTYARILIRHKGI